jgi:hypothetical protein
MPSYGVTSAGSIGRNAHTRVQVLANHLGCVAVVYHRCSSTLTYTPLRLSFVLPCTCRPSITVSATASPQLVVPDVVKKLFIAHTHPGKNLKNIAWRRLKIYCIPDRQR